MVSGNSAESLGSVFRKLFGYMESISIERELVAQMVPPPAIFAAGTVMCIDWAVAWALGVSSLITEKSRAYCLPLCSDQLWVQPCLLFGRNKEKVVRA